MFTRENRETETLHRRTKTLSPTGVRLRGPRGTERVFGLQLKAGGWGAECGEPSCLPSSDLVELADGSFSDEDPASGVSGIITEERRQ